MPIERRDDIEWTNTTFTYKIPDDFRENTFDQGKTGTFTYDGPRFLTFQINKETGRETGWCLVYPEELERPCPLDSERVTVDCSLEENGLLCEIANDQGDPKQVEFRANREWIVYFQPPEGYIPILKPTEVEPRDIYDEFNITYDFETKTFNLPIHDWSTDIDVNLTWDDIRARRDKMLKDTDGAISEDMPQALKDKWIRYRQLLREMPDALAEFPPYIAAQMWPEMPN